MARHLPPKWLASHYLPEGARSILDIGCNLGDGLLDAHKQGFTTLMGIDNNPGAVENARVRLAHIPHANIALGSANEIPFATGSAEVAICSEVLEHIPAELRKAAILEASRVLAPDAPFIVTVPVAGAFAFLDPANARFYFPWLYRFVSRAVGERRCEGGYHGKKHGVIWHHHFRLEELHDLLEPEFMIELVRYRGSFIAPIVDYLQFPFYRLRAQGNAAFKLLTFLADVDMAKDYGRWLSYNVLLLARNRRRPSFGSAPLPPPT